jgi:hypothetical protein
VIWTGFDNFQVSWNQGRDWVNVVPPYRQRSVAIDATHRWIYIISYEESTALLLLSTDSGANWVSKALPPTPNALTTLQIDPARPNRLYLQTYNSDLWVSEDGAESWSSIPQKLTSVLSDKYI